MSTARPLADPGPATGQRTVIALGGNAIAPAGTGGTAAEQTRNIERAMALVAELIVEGREIVLTHGNGPQVGNLLRKNELAKDVVPAMPLDWCVAQTQATIGYQILTALERELAGHGRRATVVPVISRVEVSADDPAWANPTKPIGPLVTDPEEVRRREASSDQHFVAVADGGWRRVVPSPEPRRLLESAAVDLLLGAGAVVVANGGGGIPMVADVDGRLTGVEAVIDKDLAGAMLAEQIGAGSLVILTDVPGVALDYGTPEQRWLGDVGLAEMLAHAADGQFSAGSMGPKVEAATRFVRSRNGPAVIAALDHVAAAVRGHAGTRILPDRSAA